MLFCEIFDYEIWQNLLQADELRVSQNSWVFATAKHFLLLKFLYSVKIVSKNEMFALSSQRGLHLQ